MPESFGDGQFSKILRQAMKVEILEQRDNAIAHVTLEAMETLLAQAGTLQRMRGQFAIETNVRRSSHGLSDKRQKRSFTGETLFLTQFQAKEDGGEIWLVPQKMGNIVIHEITAYKLIAPAPSFLACTDKIEIFLGFPDAKSPLAQRQLFWVNLAGKGKVFLNGFGGIYDIDVEKEYIVNLDRLVAFENSLKCEMIKNSAKNWRGLLKENQYYLKLTGNGKLYCQTHCPRRVASLIQTKFKLK